MANHPVGRVIRAGDTSRPAPFTICVIANPALEAPWRSGQFIVDPLTVHQAEFDASVSYVVDALFGNLGGQAEVFLGDPALAPSVRVVSLFVPGLAATDANSLVGQDGVSNLLVARRTAFGHFLARFGLVADVAYAISRSESHTRASAWFTSDDDARGGVPFTLDGSSLMHRFFCLIPGTVAQHSTSTSLTALHEFGHALSSYSNGSVVDLYVDSNPGVNNRRGRPIPGQFAVYNGTALAADPSRNGLGYEVGWQSYHCELIDPAFPAVMDNYWKAHDHVPEHCQHDRITRMFLLDRVRAKLAR
ncbi:MAG: hypothetical protein ACJ8GN_01420 [Longimicrobiaceae bacterium]